MKLTENEANVVRELKPTAKELVFQYAMILGELTRTNDPELDRLNREFQSRLKAEDLKPGEDQVYLDRMRDRLDALA